MTNAFSQRLLLAAKGAAMGMAEVVPGVSGGTIAFITGIYEELLNTIKSFNLEALKTLKKEGLAAFWKSINGNFLLSLGIGMLSGLVLGVFLISYLLEHFPVLVWAFFFGLILASIYSVAKQIKKWTWVEVLLLLLMAALSYFITIAAPTTGPQQLWFVFISGFIAICALMLPGISGSFILLLLGMYAYIVTDNVKALLTHFNTHSLIVTLVFALGCLSGLIVFSRVLSWTFKNYHNPTLAALTGFLVGSLNRVWPWQEVIIQGIDSHGEAVILQTKSVLPTHFATLSNNLVYGNNPHTLAAIASMIAGLLLVLLLEWFSKRKTT